MKSVNLNNCFRMWALLIPFTLSAAFYFHQLPSPHEPTLLSSAVKSLPVHCLALAAHLYGKTEPSRASYARLITIGLLLGSIGDILLLWPGLFVAGMISFALGHIFYIRAFGLTPLHPGVLVPMISICGALASQILPNIKDPIMAKCAPVYSAFLVGMSWRAIAHAATQPDAWSWPKIWGAVGSVFFLLSDILLSYHELVGWEIQNGQVLIMATYYAAQLGITLSVVKS